MWSRGDAVRARTRLHPQPVVCEPLCFDVNVLGTLLAHISYAVQQALRILPLTFPNEAASAIDACVADICAAWLCSGEKNDPNELNL